VKLKDLIAEYPGCVDYDLVLSDFFSIPDKGKEQDAVIVSDFPVRAVCVNDESKELRLVMFQADVSAIEQSRDHIIKMIKAGKLGNSIDRSE
jgi:hypothetical protein